MQEQTEEKRTGTWLRLGALLLAVVLIWQILAPPVAGSVSAKSQEEADTGQTIPAEADTAQGYYELASSAIADGDYETALTRLEAARDLLESGEEEPEGERTEEDRQLLAQLWLTTASLYVLTGDLEQAQTALTRTLEAEPEQEQALLLRAQLAIENTDYSGAIEDVLTYLDVNVTDTQTRQTLAQLMEQTGDYTGAEEQYQILYQQNPTEEAHRLNALRCLFLSGSYEEAVAGFDAYKSQLEEGGTDPYGGIADFLRAACLFQMDEYEAALQGFEMAEAAGYDRSACLEQITLCAFEMGQYRQVLTTGQELLEMEDGSLASPALVYQRMGMAALYLEDYETALEYVEKAEEADPALEGNDYYRGVCLLSLQRMEEAVEAFTQSIEKGYLTQFCYYNRGVCHVSLQEYEKAGQDMEATLKSGNDPELTAAAKDIQRQLDEYFAQLATQATESQTEENGT